jgi:prevent-host-death family protein
MKPAVVNVHDAKTQLSKLLARAERGERITIARSGKAVAQLGPIARGKRRRAVGVDPLLQVDEYSFDGPVAPLSNRDMDRLVYGG